MSLVNRKTTVFSLLLFSVSNIYIQSQWPVIQRFIDDKFYSKLGSRHAMRPACPTSKGTQQKTHILVVKRWFYNITGSINADTPCFVKGL